MQKIQTDESCLLKFQPNFNQVLYRTSIDVIGKHFSGLLVFKKMPDSSTRILFSSEMGFSFFDFGFLRNNGFQVFQIIHQMNKKPLIITLRKDFELIMFRNMNNIHSYALADSGLVYHAYPQSKGVNYYITDSICSKLIKMQRASSKKPVMEATVFEEVSGESPDSISICHLNFDFFISLKKIKTLASQ